MPDRDDIPAFSRSGTTNALGQLGEGAKVRLPLVTEDIARSLAAAEGLCLGEWINVVPDFARLFAALNPMHAGLFEFREHKAAA